MKEKPIYIRRPKQGYSYWCATTRKIYLPFKRPKYEGTDISLVLAHEIAHSRLHSAPYPDCSGLQLLREAEAWRLTLKWRPDGKEQARRCLLSHYMFSTHGGGDFDEIMRWVYNEG